MRRWKFLTTNLATLCARITSSAGTLIANGVAHRHMTREQYGLWIMLYSINLLTNGLDLGFQFTLGNRLAALGARGPEGETERRETFLSIFFLQLAIFLVDSLIILLLVPLIPWARWFKIADPVLAAQVPHFMPMILIVMIGTLPFGLIWTAFFAYGEITLASSLTGICNLLQTAGFVLAVYFCRFTTALFIYFSFNVGLSALLTAFLFVRRKWSFSFLPLSRIAAVVRSMARVSSHAFFHTISAIIGTVIGPIITGAVAGLVVAGDFTNVQKLFSFLVTTHLSVMAPLSPVITRDSATGNWEAVRHQLRTYIFRVWPAFYLLLGGLVWIFHPLLIHLWLGYSFANYPLAGLLLVSACMGGFTNTFSVFLNSLGLMKMQAVVCFGLMIPSILITAFLGRCFGVTGIAVSMIVCGLPLVIIWPLYTRRALRLQLLRV